MANPGTYTAYRQLKPLEGSISDDMQQQQDNSFKRQAFKSQEDKAKQDKIDKAEKGTELNIDKYKATYFQGYVSSFSKTPNSEDALELEIEFAINGIGQKGYATLTTNQAEVVSYVFKDTVKVE